MGTGGDLVGMGQARTGQVKERSEGGCQPITSHCCGKVTECQSEHKIIEASDQGNQWPEGPSQGTRRRRRGSKGQDIHAT